MIKLEIYPIRNWKIRNISYKELIQLILSGLSKEDKIRNNTLISIPASTYQFLIGYISNLPGGVRRPLLPVRINSL